MEQLTTLVIFGYISLCLIVITIGIVINFKVDHNINIEEFKEKGKVIQRILKNYCKVQCVAWPVVLSLFGSVAVVIRSPLIINHPSLTITFLHSAEFIIKLTLIYVGFNSFIIAFCRYIFIIIVTHNGLESIKSIRRIIVFASITAPIMLAILNEVFVPLAEYRIDLLPHQVEMAKKQLFNNSSGYEIRNATLIVGQSLIYNVIHDYIPQTLLYPINRFLLIVTLMALSNIIEAGLYIHIFYYNKR